MWQKAWSWGAVGAAMFFIWGGGLTFMTSGHPVVADIFYLIGGCLFAAKFVTWEDTRQHKYKNAVIAAGLVLAVALTTFGIWGNHRLNRPTLAATQPSPSPVVQRQNSEEPSSSENTSKQVIPRGKKPKSKPTAPQPTYRVTNPSGSIINQGSTIDAPQTVNNFGPPPAKITAWEQKPAQWQEPEGLVPETQLTFTTDHSMEIPAFAVKCDRPCRVRDAVVFGAYNKVSYLTTDDPNISGAVFLSPRPLGASVPVEYRVRAKDGSLPKILEVSIISPDQLK